MTEPRANCREVERKARAKSRASAASKLEKRQQKTPGYYLMLEWYRAMKLEFPGVELNTKWGAHEYTIAKKLVQEVGADRATVLVRHLVRTWKGRETGASEEEKGLPSIGYCWAIRETLGAEVDGVAAVRGSKEDRLRAREYDDEAASHPTHGWGR